MQMEQLHLRPSVISSLRNRKRTAPQWQRPLYVRTWVMLVVYTSLEMRNMAQALSRALASDEQAKRLRALDTEDEETKALGLPANGPEAISTTRVPRRDTRRGR